MKFSQNSKPEEIVLCINCNSDNTGNTKKPKLSFGIFMILFGIPYLKYKNEFYCYDCENTFINTPGE